MCKLERSAQGSEYKEKPTCLKPCREGKAGVAAQKLKGVMMSRSKMKLWMIRATTTVLLWTCVVQLVALGQFWGPWVLKGLPSCFSLLDWRPPATLYQPSVIAQKIVLPPKMC